MNGNFWPKPFRLVRLFIAVRLVQMKIISEMFANSKQIKEMLCNERTLFAQNCCWCCNGAKYLLSYNGIDMILKRRAQQHFGWVFRWGLVRFGLAFFQSSLSNNVSTYAVLIHLQHWNSILVMGKFYYDNKRPECSNSQWNGCVLSLFFFVVAGDFVDQSRFTCISMRYVCQNGIRAFIAMYWIFDNPLMTFAIVIRPLIQLQFLANKPAYRHFQ